MAMAHAMEEAFLKSLCEQQVTVSIFLMSGIKLHGVIEKVDDRVIFLRDAITQMVYKHAISTVVPARSFA